MTEEYLKRRDQMLAQKKAHYALHKEEINARNRASYLKFQPQRQETARQKYASLSPEIKDQLLSHNRKRGKLWYELNKDRAAQAQRDRIKRDHEGWLVVQNRWRKANPEKDRGRYRRRRAIRRQAEGCHTEQQWLARVEFYGWRCRYCRCSLTSETLTQDHVIAVSRGGSEWPANLVPACSSCNRKKWDSDWRDFL